MSQKAMFQKLALACLFVGTLSSASFADEISTSIQDGLKAYQGNDLADAAAQLEYATSLIQEKRSEALLSVFPKAENGWQVVSSDSSAGSAATFSGISANQSYEKGEQQLDISIAIDALIMQANLPIYSNPALARMSGLKMTKIQGNTAFIDKSDDSNIELSFIANNTALITMSGYDLSEQELKSFGEKIDLSKL